MKKIESIKQKLEKGENLTSDERKEYVLYSVTTHSDKKMYNIPSISTSCKVNPYCIARCKNSDSICSHCYAMRHLNQYNSCDKKMYYNTLFYTQVELSKDDIPLFNSLIFRFEAFGDISTVTQVKNYITICKVNKGVKFSLWTKNPGIIRQAIESGATLPKNLTIIYSNEYVNNPFTKSDFDQLTSKYPFIKKVFSVFSKQYANENIIPINCGSRKCNECRICYTSKTKIINELIK